MILVEIRHQIDVPEADLFVHIISEADMYNYYKKVAIILAICC